MKVKPIYWIALFLALALTVAVCDGLRIRDKASVIAGQYEEALNVAKANYALLDKEILDQRAVIEEKEKAIAKLNESISIIYTDISDKDENITDLVRKLHELEMASVESADLPAQIANLKEQVRVWSEKFTLAESIIAEKDNIIASWAAKYAASVQIGDAWKIQCSNEKHLRLLAEEGWNVTARKLKKSSIGNNLKTIVIYAGAVIVGLEVIKKQVNKGV